MGIRRTIQYAIVLTPAENELLYELAAAEGVSKAAYLRGLLRLEGLKRGRLPIGVSR